MIPVDQMTYGVEFEMNIPTGHMTVGEYGNPEPIPGFPVGWGAKKDGSITHPAHRKGAEVISPILRGPNGLAQIADVVAKLNAMGGKVNPSCGFHVHVGWPLAYLPKLGHLAHLTANVEKALYAVTGTKNRERNEYCRSIKPSYVRELNFEACATAGVATALTAPRPSGRRPEFAVNGSPNEARYHTLNLANIYAGRREAVEFRVFQGTLNLIKVVGYIRMCLAICQKAMDANRRPAWEAQPAQGGPALTGVEELHRFFYRVGWHRGCTPKTYGVLEAPGVPDLDATKAKLLALAKKYDEAP
jgi:hypothetical protein